MKISEKMLDGRMAVSGRTMWTCLVAFLIVIAAWFAMWRACHAYPFYMIWDMDSTTTIDVMCVNSGLTPDNISHPDCGMYLLLSWASRLGHSFGSPSAVTFDGLTTSLNPLACMAELTEFVRMVSPVVNVLACLVAWLALTAIWQAPRWTSLAALALLLSQQSLIYLSSMSRPATFCLFFWAASLGLIAVARRMSSPRGRVVIFAAGALFAGLCFLTKIQSLLYVLVLPLFMVVQVPNIVGSGRCRHESFGRRHALVASVIGAVLFFGLLAVLHRLDMPDFHGFHASAYGNTTRLKMLAVAAAGLPLVNACYCLPAGKRWRYPAFLYWYSMALPCLMLAFPLCCLLAGDVGEGCRYMLWVAKVSLMRQDYSGYVGVAGIARKLVAEGVFLWPIFLGHAVAVAAVVILWIRQENRRLGELLPLVGLSAAAVLNLGLATRCALRDVVWMEFLTNVTTVGCLFYCARILRDRRRSKGVLLGVVFLVLLLFNISASQRMLRRIDANYNVYGWNPLHWCRGFYSGRSHDVFHDLMFKRYGVTSEMGIENMPPRVNEALRQALRHGKDEQWARFVFPTLKTGVRAIGVFAQGCPVWCSRPEWVIGEDHGGASPSGSIVLDPFACERRSTGLIHRETVIEPSEWFNKLKNGDPGGQTLAVLPRQDTRIWLFVETNRVHTLLAVDGIEEEETPGGARVTMRNASSSKVLQGVEVRSYAEISWSELGSDAFFVLESLCGR